ncbi:MAG TPA: peptidoglycan DD-metalloendopeptidase family protein, partial [Methylophilaceae bacterium]|nr:peptidoglycan DD-metalloendopeptidase family protein [Methylophilaceae bacterium]
KAALSDLQERLESLKKELDSSQAAHSEAADELKQSEKAISEANRKLYELNQQYQQNQKSLQGLQQQTADTEAKLQQQRQLIGRQLYQQYLHGKQNYLQILLQQQDPNAIARQLHYFSYVSRARAALIGDMQANLGNLAKLNAETADTLKQIDTLKTAQEQERKELQAQKAERNKTLSKISAQIKSQRGEISKLKRDEKRLSQLVERLSRIVPKTTIRKHERKEPTDEKPVARNETLPSDAFDGGNFAALKGKLRLPVVGDVSNRFGSAREDTGVSWKGLFIKAEAGNEVKAVASGVVVFADWLRGFGNLLIIDHGDDYMSLYANNQALLKKVGDEVKGGDDVATVGNSGGNETPGLYFELRYRSQPIDPLSWSVH